MLSGESQFKLQIVKANKKVQDKNNKQRPPRKQIGKNYLI